MCLIGTGPKARGRPCFMRAAKLHTRKTSYALFQLLAPVFRLHSKDALLTPRLSYAAPFYTQKAALSHGEKSGFF